MERDFFPTLTLFAVSAAEDSPVLQNAALNERALMPLCVSLCTVTFAGSDPLLNANAPS